MKLYHGSIDRKLQISNLKFPGSDFIGFFTTPEIFYAALYAFRVPGHFFHVADLDAEGYIYEIDISDDAKIFDVENPEDADILKTALGLELDHIRALQHSDWLEVEKYYPELSRYHLASTLKKIGYDGYYNWDELRGCMDNVRYIGTYAEDEAGIDVADELGFETEASAVVLLSANKIKSFKKHLARVFLNDNDICLPEAVEESLYMERPLNFVQWDTYKWQY